MFYFFTRNVFEQLATRLLSEMSKIPSEKIRTGNISKMDLKTFLKIVKKLRIFLYLLTIHLRLHCQQSGQDLED